MAAPMERAGSLSEFWGSSPERKESFGDASERGNASDNFRFFPREHLQDAGLLPQRPGSKESPRQPIVRNLIDISACNWGRPRTSSSLCKPWEDRGERRRSVGDGEAAAQALTARSDRERCREALIVWKVASALQEREARLERLERANAELRLALAAAQTRAAPVVAAPVLEAPVVATPVVAAPVVAAPVLAAPASRRQRLLEYSGVVAWNGVVFLWTYALLAVGEPRLALASCPFWVVGARLLCRAISVAPPGREEKESAS